MSRVIKILLGVCFGTSLLSITGCVDMDPYSPGIQQTAYSDFPGYYSTNYYQHGYYRAGYYAPGYNPYSYQRYPFYKGHTAYPDYKGESNYNYRLGQPDYLRSTSGANQYTYPNGGQTMYYYTYSID